MPEIRQLSPSVVNKIAAGEVIERPASVVKELVENSVDSGATRIDVTVEQGGSQLIRVVDNGCGIHADQLLLAVASHATSKIRDADDLFRVSTLGFRGEALASIAEISQFRIVSRPADISEAAELEVLGGNSQPIVPCGAPTGTTIEVRNLFFNTPVRRKFMRTVQTELGHVSEAFIRIALPHPQVHFTLRHNDRVIHDLTPVESWRERIVRCFGDDLGEQLIWVESNDEQIRLSGYVANPSYNRSNNRLQYLFLNGRFIRDRSLQHALGEAYRGLLMQGRFPVAMLRLDLPPEIVDVNVHPTKLEVRFQDGSRIYSKTLSAIRNRFLATDLTARVTSSAPARDAAQNSQKGDAQRDSQRDSADSTGGTGAADPRLGYRDGTSSSSWANPAPSSGRPGQVGPHGGDSPGGASPPGDAARRPDPGRSASQQAPPWPGSGGMQRGFEFAASDASSSTADRRVFDRSLVDWARGGPSSAPPANSSPPSASPPLSGPDSSAPASSVPWPSEPGLSGGEQDSTSSSHRGGPDGSCSISASSSSFQVGSSQAGQRNPPVLQIHDRYLVVEGDEGMVVIDQHALHERVLYERLREKVLAGRVEMQRLLVPEPVTLSPVEAAMVLDHQEALGELGIQVEPFGGDTVLVSGYPAMLQRISPGEILRQAVELLMNGNGEVQRRDLMDEMLHMMACKAAVKAGDPLSSEEIVALLEHRELCLDSHHCPHGRPTALVFSCDELDKRFGRT